MPSIIVRPARRTDALALAALVDIAGEGIAAWLWGPKTAPGQSLFEFGRGRAMREEGDFSYRNATVAEVDGEVAAQLLGYRQPDPYEVGDLGALPEVVRPLVLLEAQAPGSWYLNALATFPEFRGQGLGARLLAIAEDAARASGATSISIIAAEENAGAVALYGRTGYREAARLPIVPFPGFVHGGDWLLLVKTIAA